MTPIPAWRRYLRFWRADVVADVDDELRFHTEMRVADYVSRGMSDAEARRVVAERLGDISGARAECVELGEARERQARQADFVDGLRADARYALRSLAKTPGWTAVALLTIALGVGATTAVFNVVDALLVRPLPYRDASRVYMARREFHLAGQTVPGLLPGEILPVWREQARTVEAIVPYGGEQSAWLENGPDSIEVHTRRVGRGLMPLAGIAPIVGRNFEAQEMVPGGPGAVLLTEPFWLREFGGARDVVGRVVRLGGRPSTIVGVVPSSLVVPDFRVPRAEVLLPFQHEKQSGAFYLVRVKPGVPRDAAAAELDAILSRTKVFDVRPVPGPAPVRLSRPQDWLAIRQPLVMLTGAVALLLLVACTNVAHLLLARGAARQRELAVRHALGAGRARLVRQLVTESVVLALLGGALAMIVGWASLRALEAARPEDLVSLSYVAPGRTIVTIAAALAMVAGVGVGILAGLRVARRDLAASLHSSAPGVAVGHRLRSALVVGQVALSATLLVGALLLTHAVFDLQRTQLGFDADGLYAFRFQLPRTMAAAEGAAFAERARDRLATVPGVRGVTLAASVPGPQGWTWRMLGALETPGHPRSPEDASRSFAVYNVAPDYFSLMRMPVVAGHTFDQGSATRHEVIVSETLARQLWPDGNAVGRQLRAAMPRSRGTNEPWQTVIGVVPDVVTSLVSPPDDPGLYHPLLTADTTAPFDSPTLVVRLDDERTMQRVASVATAMRPAGAQMTIANVRDAMDKSMADPLFIMRILVTFAALGVVLAAVGLFGVVSYTVSQRTREIGVRMTLGATRRSIARLVLGDGVRLALVGIAIGLLGASAATRLIRSLLFGVPALDPFAFAVGAVLLLAVSAIACLVPTMRATSVDPAIAVRAE